MSVVPHPLHAPARGLITRRGQCIHAYINLLIIVQKLLGQHSFPIDPFTHLHQLYNLPYLAEKDNTASSASTWPQAMGVNNAPTPAYRHYLAEHLALPGAVDTKQDGRNTNKPGYS